MHGLATGRAIRPARLAFLLDRDLAQIKPAMLRVFDRSQDAAFFLPTQQRASAPSEKL